MRTFFYFLLCAAVFSVFIGCSTNEGGNGNGNSNPGVNVSTAGKSLDDLLADAIKALKSEQWDEAVAYYDAAYNLNNSDARAIIYSTLANLAKISTDPKVAALMKNHFGFVEYPNRLNALFSTEWMKKYPDLINYGYYDETLGKYVYWEEARWGDVDKDGYYYFSYDYGYTLVSATPKYDSTSPVPIIKTPDWIKGNGSIYNEALLGGNVFSFDNWALSLVANILDKNLNGLNGLLDDVIDGVFEGSYKTAVERLKKLENRKEERINLDPYFINKLSLEDIFDEYDKIGWAEVNAVLSAMLVVKASLEWVQSYDLSVDLNWLKFAWKDEPDVFLEQFKKADASKLPFNGNFLKPRPGKMANAKADYIKAIKGFQESYTSIQSSELYPEQVKKAYKTINGGFDELIKAIDKGTMFYIPEDPTEGSWPTTGSDYVVRINMERLFTEGYFSLQNMFETNNGKQPVFYLRNETCDDYYYCDYTYIKLDKSNYLSFISEGGRMSLAFKDSFIKDAEDMGNEIEDKYTDIGFNGDEAKIIFEKYYP